MFVCVAVECGCLVASQLGEGGVHLVGQALVPVLVDAQLICLNMDATILALIRSFIAEVVYILSKKYTKIGLILDVR